MTNNYITITSSEDLQSRLNADLTRLSILNFRADWAEPCRTMDEVAKQLAQKHSSALFLEVCPCSHLYTCVLSERCAFVPDRSKQKHCPKFLRALMLNLYPSL